nr:MAG TPA: hypothetical protein [Caudoviricetes sp.]
MPYRMRAFYIASEQVEGETPCRRDSFFVRRT